MLHSARRACAERKGWRADREMDLEVGGVLPACGRVQDELSQEVDFTGANTDRFPSDYFKKFIDQARLRTTH